MGLRVIDSLLGRMEMRGGGGDGMGSGWEGDWGGEGSVRVGGFAWEGGVDEKPPK